jgi:site-specific DNA-methyltransferase (adenine-specific)
VLEGRARWALLHADCAKTLAELPDASVDALVTDPPAGIGFMGKDWDSHKGGREAWVSWLAGVMRECLRVLKPGGHGLVWALPRTSHWTGWALELAGFEVRDRVAHLFGTGFPKSLDVQRRITAPATPEAARWSGFGTALKPACEDWWLVRKPLDGTVAQNVLRHGTGALNIDGCRVETGDDLNGGAYSKGAGAPSGAGFTIGRGLAREYIQPSGRWPANVTLDEAAARAVDEASGDRSSHGDLKPYERSTREFNAFGKPPPKSTVARTGDTGGASRFFYTAKADRSERDGGLELLPWKSGAEACGRKEGSAGMISPRAGANSGGGRNIHPTVKPLSLMRWLVRLVTPPGGLVLDPFSGSGTTGIAALHEGARFLGCEADASYFAIAHERLSAWHEVKENLTTIEARAAGQLALFAGGTK